MRVQCSSNYSLAIIDQKSNQIIGSSRFTHNDPAKSSIEVGRVPSQIGSYAAVIYQMKKTDWTVIAPSIAPDFVQPDLTTTRLILEPITENHAEELWELFRDPELHLFIPFEPISLEKELERCVRWSKRRSPDGTEIWLNWIARDKSTGQAIGHFQVGIKPDGVASIGYLVSRKCQNKGFSTEALEVIFPYLRDGLGVREVKAWSDTRNTASHRLAKKLGMVQVEFIKDADFFKGATSDEYVFSKVLQ